MGALIGSRASSALPVEAASRTPARPGRSSDRIRRCQPASTWALGQVRLPNQWLVIRMACSWTRQDFDPARGRDRASHTTEVDRTVEARREHRPSSIRRILSSGPIPLRLRRLRRMRRPRPRDRLMAFERVTIPARRGRRSRQRRDMGAWPPPARPVQEAPASVRRMVPRARPAGGRGSPLMRLRRPLDRHRERDVAQRLRSAGTGRVVEGVELGNGGAVEAIAASTCAHPLRREEWATRRAAEL